MTKSYKTSLKKVARYGLFIAVLGLVFTAFSCAQKKTATKNPAGYNLDAPQKYSLPVSLTEISGLAFYKGDPKTIFAHEDETGKVFYFGFGDADVKHVKFGAHGDYEDIAICKEQVIVLRSDGAFFVFPFKDIRNGTAENDVKTYSDLLPKGEYESMYADEKTGTIYVACKTCKSDKKDGETSGYTFTLAADGSIKQAGNFSIDNSTITGIGGNKKKGIRLAPSALTKNPATGEWYVLSSVNKLLVVTDANWKVKDSYPLNPSLFPQPEGIAFDRLNNLYISNEGGLGSGTILKFAYKK